MRTNAPAALDAHFNDGLERALKLYVRPSQNQHQNRLLQPLIWRSTPTTLREKNHALSGISRPRSRWNRNREAIRNRNRGRD